MNQDGKLFRFGKPALACALSIAVSGCVAIDAGKPETFTHTETTTKVASSPSSWEVTAARGESQQAGNKLVAGIAADVLEGYAKIPVEETVVVRKQKRLAIGFFPGAAERFLMPDGALDSGQGFQIVGYADAPRFHWQYGEEVSYAGEHLYSILMVGIPYVFGTVNSLLIQPFAGWSCGHDHVDKKNLKEKGFVRGTHIPILDASDSPKLCALERIPEAERKQIGVRTCFDRSVPGGFFTHMGLVGCHKYLGVFVAPVERKEGPPVGEEIKFRRADVEGPYMAELSIPGMGYAQEVRVGKGAKHAEFELPVAERKCVVEAVMRFRADGEGSVSEVTRRALEKVAGQEYRFDVTLQGGATAAAAAVPAAAPRAGGGAYEVVGITPSENGQYEVRVRIADKSKTFDIGWAVEPDVKRMIREDFANRHPGTGIQYVREMVEWETEEDGAILVYRGWAFSARPVSDGWTYDDGSRRGTVRLRISEGMPPDEAKRWARENIEAIVKEKNVALEAGKAPPEGAVYRSLGETLEDGVLTVEFEAVE